VIEVTAQFFGPAADWAGCGEKAYLLNGEPTLDELVDRVQRDFPRLREAARFLRYAVNCNYADPETLLNNGDEVAVIPPVTGG
jgi:molybdopterin converting factor small subunit